MDLFEIGLDLPHNSIARLAHFLQHVAHEHTGGSHVNLVRVQDWASAYENNYAVGKPAMTIHEEKWREREELVPDTSDVGRASFEARIVESP